MNSTFSVITPTLNSEEYIEGNLISVHLQQKIQGTLEQIIVDGLSTDHTIEIIQSFTKKYDANIKLIQGKDTSLYDAINKALKSGIGDIWSCLNCDDRYKPYSLNLIENEFISDPSLDVVYGPLDRYDELGKYTHTDYFSKFNLDYLIMNKICTNILLPSTFFRNAVLDKVGYFNTNYRFASDYDYLIRVGSLCNLKYVPIHTTRFSDRSTSISRNVQSSRIQLLESKNIADYYIKKYSINRKLKTLNDISYLKNQIRTNNIRYILRRFPILFREYLIQVRNMCF